jgi:malonyl-CoA decarboxylase
MSEERNESFFERALANLAGAWREVAAGAARSVGLSGPGSPARDADALERLMAECLEARGGEVSARLRAAELGRAYLDLDGPGRRSFLEVLARRFAADTPAVERAIADYRDAEESDLKLAAEDALRRALIPPRLKLLTQFNVLPEGVKFLADLRSDLLSATGEDPHLRGLERDLRELLESWFDVGFLDLRAINWDSPASLLEKLIAYEAVHAIRSWDDLRNRLDSDRRLYALFHPRMPDEPLAFVEVALVKGLAGNIQALLDESVPPIDPREVDTAIFYSISNTQRGLTGISFGDYLIKRVVARFSKELPRLKTFATLSPVPGFRRWLDGRSAELIGPAFAGDEMDSMRELGGSVDAAEALQAVLARPDWHREAAVTSHIKMPLMRLCGRYFLETGKNGKPLDSVARFHLRNGARLERINWLADISDKGLEQSAGLMVNYRYLPADIEKNHEAYMEKGQVIMSAEVRGLAKQAGRR